MVVDTANPERAILNLRHFGTLGLEVVNPSKRCLRPSTEYLSARIVGYNALNDSPEQGGLP